MKIESILTGDSLEVLKTFEDNSIDAVVTDPPYGISFMAKKWDHDVPSVELWTEVLRVLKPGGYALIACGTRTQHRMVVNIEDAGFEVRDVITWLYGSGFPKSLDVSKAIDKMHGAEREVVCERIKLGDKKAYCQNISQENQKFNTSEFQTMITAPSTPDAIKWQGYGTALKPSAEFWTLVRKPLSESTVAKNVLKHGTGALNIDASRVGQREKERFSGGKPLGSFGGESQEYQSSKRYEPSTIPLPQGRWPANLILDEEAGALLDEQSGQNKSTDNPRNNKPSQNLAMSGANTGHVSFGYTDSGGASRFFYCPKSSKAERNAGLDLPTQKVNDGRNTPIDNPYQRGETERINSHPTVKPIKLMEYLIKLITPTGGIVLDPFAGSGSTCVAAKKLGFDYIGIELNEEYAEIAKARCL